MTFLELFAARWWGKLRNGPKLMINEIVEHRGITMPNLTSYALIALVVMIPPLVAVTFLFFPTT